MKDKSAENAVGLVLHRDDERHICRKCSGISHA
ncbi:hypothetical protein F4694_006329 [Bacillus niacini]|uniref:Uncharacterized protein n=1 Tax=Neobacillus niacini TaxID=86668 RepID=A0A852TKA7_9BACI|nr:hypothetical protein [Neobacillus niacini]